MNFWDKVQQEIQSSSARLTRKGRRGSTDSVNPDPGSSNSPRRSSVVSPVKKHPSAGNFVVGEDEMGLADEILASPVRGEARPRTGKRDDGDGMPVAPPRARRTGGWADDAVPPRSAARERFREGEEMLKHESDDEVPAIPDLDDVQAEDFSNQVALAPSVAVNRVATFKELDSDLFRHGAFATLDDIDLRALVKCMAPEPETREPDTEWTWDALLTEVTSEVLKDQLASAGENEEDGEGDKRLSSAYVG